MTAESTAGELGNHGARIKNLEKTVTKVESKLDKLFWAIMGTLATSCGTLLVILFKHGPKP